MTTGQLDITAFPLAYAAKFHPEFRYYFDAWNCEKSQACFKS